MAVKYTNGGVFAVGHDLVLYFANDGIWQMAPQMREPVSKWSPAERKLYAQACRQWGPEGLPFPGALAIAFDSAEVVTTH